MNRTAKIALIIAAIIIAVGIGAYAARGPIERWFFRPTGSSLEQGVETVAQNETEIVAQNLSVPWEIAFLPDGDMLVTERPGTLKRIGGNQQAYPIEGVEHRGEGGLQGLAVHPDFARNNYLYLYLTTRNESGLVNRVERYRLDDNQLSDKQTIIDDIPGAAYHDGGRIAFGPDALLYIGTGDAGNEQLAQDTTSLAGKILRIRDDGTIPADNPFGNAVYSYGHRNVQGLAWDEEDRLWATEHGPSGSQSGFDELNLIEKGNNYGWPLIRGDETREGMVTPVVQSGATETWAPSGMAYWNGSLFFSGLRGETLYEAQILDTDSVQLIAHLAGEYGRLRATVAGKDGSLYLSSSNTDGRGSPQPNDDKVIRLAERLFNE